MFIMRILINSIRCYLWYVNVVIFYFNGIILLDLYKLEICKFIRSGLEIVGIFFVCGINFYILVVIDIYWLKNIISYYFLKLL